LTGEEPFSDLNSVEELIEAVCEEKRRPVIPATCPSSLRTLIERCWSHSHSERPKFKEIIDILDDVILEGVIGDRIGVRFWQRAFGTSERVNFQVFARKLLTFCKVKFEGESSATYLCLEDLLSKDTVVTTQSFHEWLQFFGPLQPDPKIISNMVDLLRQSWFHGNVATTEAERLLNGRSEGTFLVRFSSLGGSYTVSCLRSGRIMHYRANRQGAQLVIGQVAVDNVDQLVHRCKQQLGLGEPLSGSRYQRFFAVKAAEASGPAYLELDTLPSLSDSFDTKASITDDAMYHSQI
jgi:hypothetical protein